MLPANASETGVAPNEKSPLPNPGGELADILAKGFADYDPRRDGARTAEMGQADTAVGRSFDTQLPPLLRQNWRMARGQRKVMFRCLAQRSGTKCDPSIKG
jgi:hypothetical protein